MNFIIGNIPKLKNFNPEKEGTILLTNQLTMH